MNIALAQLNPVVGDIDHNRRRIVEAIQSARSNGADLVVFSELVISGYPPRDLLHAEGFVHECAQTVKMIGEQHTKDIAVVIGTPLPIELDAQGLELGPEAHTHIANSLVVYQDNAFVGYYDKRLLPTYDVFDEDRYFVAGDQTRVFEIGGVRIGLAICEDLWKGQDAGFADRYSDKPDPVKQLIDAGAEMIVVPSASPYALHKDQRHREIVIRHATTHRVPVVSVNQVGANDDLIFSGQSCMVDAQGRICALGRAFDEDLIIVDASAPTPIEPPPIQDERMVIEALTLGVRDYLRKCGFQRACIGLSGGIDSALVATLAVRAFGQDKVVGASMPGRFSSEGSKIDAFDLAQNLGIACVSMPIEPGFAGLSEVLDPAFEELGHAKLGQSLPDLTQENLQSRIRGTMMMALSNRSGALVLTTGNKSEIAVGYCTLYGDMNGGLAVIADLPKTMVFKVSRYINEHYESLGFSCPPIPTNTIEKPPSAELAPNQLDSDSLPDYEILDEIVLRHIELHQSTSRIVEETGYDPEVVRRFCRMIDRNEYKRQQMAVGLRVTSKAFGPGRRMPIAQNWNR
ncbi:MAG: NAD+ synthase [Phycisphaerales bacterium JB047]